MRLFPSVYKYAIFKQTKNNKKLAWSNHLLKPPAQFFAFLYTKMPLNSYALSLKIKREKIRCWQGRCFYRSRHFILLETHGIWVNSKYLKSESLEHIYIPIRFLSNTSALDCCCIRYLCWPPWTVLKLSCYSGQAFLNFWTTKCRCKFFTFFLLNKANTRLDSFSFFPTLLKVVEGNIR